MRCILILLDHLFHTWIVVSRERRKKKEDRSQESGDRRKETGGRRGNPEYRIQNEESGM